MQSTIHTIGTLGKLYGIPAWQVRRAIERGFLTEPQRVGAYRVFLPNDLPRVREALVAAGYLPEEVAHAN